jgi:hypothetical protein
MFCSSIFSSLALLILIFSDFASSREYSKPIGHSNNSLSAQNNAIYRNPSQPIAAQHVKLHALRQSLRFAQNFAFQAVFATKIIMSFKQIVSPNVCSLNNVQVKHFEIQIFIE